MTHPMILLLLRQDSKDIQIYVIVLSLIEVSSCHIDLNYVYGGYMSKAWKISDRVLSFCQGWKNWHGSFYELGLAYTSATLDKQARSRLLQYLWDDTDLLGVVFHPDEFGELWKNASAADTSNGKHTYGYIRLATNRIIGCGSYFSSDKDVSWLVLYIPLAMLNLVYSVDYAYPITHKGNPWTLKVDEALAAIGTRLYREFPFKIGGLGEEASAVPVEKQIAELARDPGLLVPESLFKRAGMDPDGLRTSEGLWWTGGTKDTRYKKNET